MNSTVVRRLLCITLLASILPFASAALRAQEVPVRIATYDLLSYSGDVAERNNGVRMILREIEPTILFVQKLIGGGGASFIANSWNEAGIKQAPPLDSARSNGLYYNDLVVGFVSYTPATVATDYDEWVMSVRGTTDTIHLFGVSFDPGDDATSRAARTQSAIAIRSALIGVPKGHHTVVLGALNVYTSNEEAYQALTQEGTFTSNVVDPIDLPGSWNNDSTFADIHTQSTRANAFGGGAGGGMDDRFDFILCSPAMLDAAYVPGSYTAFGNDGIHFNKSINDFPNLVVDDSIANALYNVSDHIPVYADFSFGGGAGSVPAAAGGGSLEVGARVVEGGAGVVFTLRQSHESIASLRLYNMLGQEVAALPEGELRGGVSQAHLDIRSLPSGRYIYTVDAGGMRRSGIVEKF